jgi:sugar phosphate isomerase/epimerase
MHAGFIDHRDEAYAARFYERIRVLADAAHAKGLKLLMETGQESAAELKQFLDDLDHPALGINFDPANMILYDKDDPVDAVIELAPWIRHVHIKDARRTRTPGEWGEEVPWGDGEVGMERFLSSLQKIGYDGALAIEREAGDQRLEDMRTAVERLTA